MARRVNKPFLIIFTVAIALGLGGLLGLNYMQGRGSSPKHWKKADEMAALKTADGYRAAVASYERALKYDMGNVDGWIKYGDALHELARYDTERAGAATGPWEQALERNPRHVGALERLLQAYIDRSEIDMRPEVFNHLRDRARTLAQVQPENVRAQIYQHIAAIGAWQAGAPTPERDVEVAVASLKELWPKHRDQHDIIWAIARANLQMARNRDAAGDPAAAKLLREQTFALFEEGMKERPQDAALAWRNYRFHGAVYESTPNATPEMREAVNAQFEKAAAIVKPEDEEYVDIMVQKAKVIGRSGKPEEMLKRLEELLAERPQDQALRLELASMYRLVPTSRTKALELLSQPIADDAKYKGFKAHVRRFLEFQRLLDLTSVRLDLYPGTPDAERPALKLALQESYDKAAAIFSEEQRPELLKLRGRMLLLEGGNKILEAIDVLQRAVVKFEQRRIRDRELYVELANLYKRARETGQRRAILTKLLVHYPSDTAVRKEVIMLLAGERKFDQANAHLEALEKTNKADPDIARLRLAIALGQQDKVRGREIVDALPEKTSNEALVKADGYLRLGDVEAATKIISAQSALELAEAKPASLNASIALAKLHLIQKRAAEALKVLDAAAAKDPELGKRTEFQVLHLIAEGKGTAEQINDLLDQQVTASDADPLEIAVSRYLSLRNQRKPDEALAVMREAEAQHPNSGQVAEILFSYFLESGRVDESIKYMERLEKMDWDQAGGNYFRARYHIARGKDEDKDPALKAAQEASRRMPGISRTWVVLGQAQHFKGQFEAAITSYHKALEMQVDNPDALRGLVQCYLGMENYTAARRYNDHGLRLRNVGSFFVEMGQQLDEIQGDPRNATARREAGLKSDPSANNYLALARNYTLSADYLAKTDAKAAEEFRVKARNTLSEAVAKYPDDRMVYQHLADHWLRVNQPEEALKVVGQLMARDKWKDEAQGPLMLAGIYRSWVPPKLPEAEAAMLEAVKRSEGRPINTGVRLQLANYYLSLGEAHKALDVLSELVKQTGDPLARQHLIQIHTMVGQFGEAEKQVQAALKAAPKQDPALYCILASIRRRQEDYRGAEEAVAKALELDARFAFALYERGMIRSDQGNTGEALTDLTSARELGLDTVDLRLELAKLYRRRGEPDAAAAELERALGVYPDRADFRLQLIELYSSQLRWNKVEQIINDAKALPQNAKNPIWFKLESGMWMARKEPGKAFTAIHQAHKLNVELKQNDPSILQAYLQILLVQKAYDQIIADTDKALLLKFPPTHWLHTARGRAFQAKGNTDAMNAEIDLALSAVDKTRDDDGAPHAVNQIIALVGAGPTIARLKDRADPRWQIELARVYAASKLWDDCIATVDNLIGPNFEKLSPAQQLRALGLGADLYAISSTFVPAAIDKAIKTCNRYVEELEKRKRPMMEHLHALNNLANMLAEHPRNAQPVAALAFSKRAYDIMHRTGRPVPAVADTHGWVMVLAGRVDEGIGFLREAASARENVPVDAYYHLGEAYLRKNRAEDALSYLEKARSVLKENEAKGLLIDPLMKGRIDTAHERARKLANAAAASNIR